jgi:hypothetical protein
VYLHSLAGHNKRSLEALGEEDELDTAKSSGLNVEDQTAKKVRFNSDQPSETLLNPSTEVQSSTIGNPSSQTGSGIEEGDIANPDKVIDSLKSVVPAVTHQDLELQHHMTSPSAVTPSEVGQDVSHRGQGTSMENIGDIRDRAGSRADLPVSISHAANVSDVYAGGITPDQVDDSALKHVQ